MDILPPSPSTVSTLALFRFVALDYLYSLQNSTDLKPGLLEAETLEKVYVVAGPEFGDREGHTLVIFKALYGLRSSGLRWHERFADCLHDMGFKPSKSEPDIWMRKNGNVYEYGTLPCM
jgi:hypothetical protein